MDLSALGSTLPPGLADAERDMGDKFRASALSITNLYKSSLSYTKQAYQVGYSACLSDVLSTVQSSIAGGQDATQTLSRLMDWAEARETAMAAFAAEETDDPTASNNAQAQAAAGNSATNAPVPLRRAALTKQALSHLQPPRPASAPLPEHRQHQSPDYASSPLVDKSNESRSKPMMSSTPASPDPAQQNQWQPTPTPHFASSSSSTPSASSSSVLPRQPFFNPNNASTAGSSSSRKVHHSPVRSTSAIHGVNVPQSTFNPAIPALPHAGMPFTTTTQHVSVGSKRALVDYEMADDSAPPANAARNAPSRAAKRRSMGTGVLSKSIEEGGDSDGNQRDRDRDRDRDGHRERRRGGKRNGGAGGVGTA